MRCKRCKMECFDDELINGLCSECIENGVETENKYKSNDGNLKTNAVSFLLEIISIIIFILSIISLFAGFATNIGFIVAIASFLSCSFIALLLRGFAEIIQLLEEIKNK